VIAGCLLFYPLEAIFGVSEEINYKRDMAGFILYPVVAMTAISFTPIKSLIKGLTFVVIGLGILLISSEISKLNLHEYLIPPKHF
jgi:hypothetical protein